jgi:hypothetical protein
MADTMMMPAEVTSHTFSTNGSSSQSGPPMERLTTFMPLAMA